MATDQAFSDASFLFSVHVVDFFHVGPAFKGGEHHTKGRQLPQGLEGQRLSKLLRIDGIETRGNSITKCNDGIVCMAQARFA
jgi:hypothetical protein